MKKIIQKLALVLCLGVISSSCKKGFDKNFDLSNELKSVMINAAYEKPTYQIVKDPPAPGTNIMLDLGNISLSSPKANEDELTITLRQNNTLLADYNTLNASNIIPFPSNAIILPLVVKIPAGSKQVNLQAEVNPAFISLANSYAIGLSIVSVTGANGIVINNTHKDCLYTIVIKNKYDGKYVLTGNTMVDVTNSSFTGLYPIQYDFITAGTDEVILQHNDYTGLGNQLHPFLVNPTTYSAYGNFGMRFKFDLNTNKAIAVTNIYGQPSPAPQFRYASIDPTGINQWNSTTKNLKIKYNMHQQASVPSAPHIRTIFDENFDYLGPR